MTSEPFPESALDGASAHIQELAKQHVDDVYGAILNSVQDYLIDNAQFNIGQKIATAQRGEKDALAKVATLEAEKAELLEALIALTAEAHRNMIGGAGHLIDDARAAIAKAGGAS